jgi:hypothetical protein
MARPRERTFAMLPCGMDEWKGWTELSPMEQWAYLLLRRQREVTPAGTLRLSLNRWARESDGMTTDELTGLLLGLAAKDYIIVDFDFDEVLLCWFISTDGVYKRPNPMSAAATAISHVKSPGIRSSLYNELVQLLKSEQVPVLQEGPIQFLIGQLESFALIDTRQPLHTPSTRVAQPVYSGSATRVEPMHMGSGAPAHAMSMESPTGQTTSELGQDNPCTRVLSIRSSVGSTEVKDQDLNQSQNPSSSEAAEAEQVQVQANQVQAQARELCEHLRQRIVDNGAVRIPAITEKWLDAARLMLTKEKIPPENIRTAINWCQDDEFWRGNVLSMPKLREQFDVLRLAAQRKAKGNGNGNGGGRHYETEKTSGVEDMR